MRSSISSSKPRTARRAIASLLACIVLLGVAVEIFTAVGFARVSRIQRRIQDEYNATRALRPTGPRGHPTVLLVGNSLLLEGVDVAEFQASMEPAYDGSRFAIEQTQYLDWYFGLRRLFLEGARPEVVVLCLNARQLLAPDTRGEYFARFQMAPRDLLAVAREERLDATAASNYLFANWSSWWGSRSEIRKWLLGRMLPDLFSLTGLLVGEPGPPPPGDVIRRVASRRLALLKEIAGAHAARFLLVLPPAKKNDGSDEAVRAAGQSVGVPVLAPYAPAEMPSDRYRDGFHLNEKGAALFTGRLARDLLALLAR